MTRIPIPPPQEPLTVSSEGRANDNWYRYWDDTGRGVNENTTAVAALPSISTATTFAQTILATTTASQVRTILGVDPAVTTGSWTPDVAIGGSTIASAPSIQVGRYVRTNKKIEVWGAIQVTTLGVSTGALTIAGLPVKASSTTPNISYPVAIGRHQGMGAPSTSFITAEVTTGSSVITVLYSGVAGATAYPSTNLSTNFRIDVSVSYETTV